MRHALLTHKRRGHMHVCMFYVRSSSLFIFLLHLLLSEETEAFSVSFQAFIARELANFQLNYLTMRNIKFTFSKTIESKFAEIL